MGDRRLKCILDIGEVCNSSFGPVATALVVRSRLGIPYCVIGDDDTGEKLWQFLIEEGIDITGRIKRGGATPQVSFIAIEKGSVRRTIFWRRPLRRVTKRFLPAFIGALPWSNF